MSGAAQQVAGASTNMPPGASQPPATTSGSSWGSVAGVASPDLNQQQMQHRQRDALLAAYREALRALDAAAAAVSAAAAMLHDHQAGQTDVSARLAGRSAQRCSRKRKLSPSVFDFADGGACAFTSKADTPTQELLPASRSELRSHQLAAVRWLSSLERGTGGGVLADEIEDDRRAAVAGLLSHLASTPPAPALPPPLSPLRVSPTHPMPPAQPGGSGSAPGPAAAPPPIGSLGTAAANVCVLVAPGSSLRGWSVAISSHVDVRLHMYDGSAASAAALQAALAGGSACGVPSQPPAPSPLMAQRRGACGGAGPGQGGGGGGGGGSSGSSGSGPSSAAGVFPPLAHAAFGGPTYQQQSPHPLFALSQHQPQHHACYPAHAAAAPGGGGSLLVVLAPLETLHRDAPLLASLPLRLVVADLVPRAAGSGGGGAERDGGGGSSGERMLQRYGLCPGSGPGPGGLGRGAGGMDVGEQGRHLTLLARLQAGCRVLLSGGDVQPLPGDGMWQLLGLLAPQLQRSLWDAVNGLHTSMLAAASVAAEDKESFQSSVYGRLLEVVRPLVLHRRARDVDLSTMRAASTNLNLYDHFSAARADGAAS